MDIALLVEEPVSLYMAVGMMSNFRLKDGVILMTESPSILILTNGNI